MTAVNALQLVLLAALTLALGIPGILLGMLLPGRAWKGRLFRIVSKSYGHAAFAFFRIRVEGRGLENIDPEKPYVFMANHISHADSPALAMVIPQPLYWVFKKELAKIPVFGWVLLALGQIMVDRADAGQSRAALSAAARELSGNGSIMIYPEGTRSRDGALLPLKKGGFRLAIACGLPIVPVRVSGSREIVAAESLRVRPGTVTIEITAPIPTAGAAPGDIPRIMDRVREALAGPGAGTPGPA
jgi:1-acyl-sn-glycerol-3-phosphate acyltransferase